MTTNTVSIMIITTTNYKITKFFFLHQHLYLNNIKVKINLIS